MLNFCAAIPLPQVHACFTNVPIPVIERQFAHRADLAMFRDTLERQAPDAAAVSIAIMELCDGGSLKQAIRQRLFHHKSDGE